MTTAHQTVHQPQLERVNAILLVPPDGLWLIMTACVSTVNCRV